MVYRDLRIDVKGDFVLPITTSERTALSLGLRLYFKDIRDERKDDLTIILRMGMKHRWYAYRR